MENQAKGFDPSLVRDKRWEGKELVYDPTDPEGFFFWTKKSLTKERLSLVGANFNKRGCAFMTFVDCDLENADFSVCDLTDTDFINCNLKGAKFKDAYLYNSSFEGCILPDFQIPQDVDLIVWKKLVVRNGGFSGFECIAKLRIPAEAKRTASLIGKKCRAEFAEVLEICVLQTGGSLKEASSLRTTYFVYKVGEIVRSLPEQNGGVAYCDDMRFECRPGIHFFMNEEDARAYNY